MDHQRRNFFERHGDIASFILVPIKETMLQAAMRFWDLSYQCVTFGKEDLVLVIEEYSIMLGVDLQHPDKVYNKKSRARS